MKRSEFKSLVKECLLELLSEQFISSTVKQAISESITRAAAVANTTATQKRLVEVKQNTNGKQATTQQNNSADAQAIRQKLRELMAPDTLHINDSKTSNSVERVVAPIVEESDEERMKKFKETLARVKSGQSNQQAMSPKQAPERIVENTNRNNNDPLSSIFQDTAETTLLKQMVNQPGELAPNDPGIDISAIANPAWKTLAGIKS